MCLRIVKTVFILQHLVSLYQCARILGVFPSSSISHQLVLRALTQVLTDRGHDLVIITTDPAYPKGHAPANMKEIDIHNVSYTFWKSKYLSVVSKSVSDPVEYSNLYYKVTNDLFERQINSDVLQNFINGESKNFDLILVEGSRRIALGMSHVFKAPVITISTFQGLIEHYKAVGAPINPAVYPHVLRSILSTNIPIVQKIKMHFEDLLFLKEFKSSESEQNKLLKKLFGDDCPELETLYRNQEMILINAHPMWENNRPVPLGMLHMGGIHIKPVQALPKDLEEYLNNSRNGVIYVSFGSNVQPSMLPNNVQSDLLKVFASIDFDVLFKYDQDLHDIPKNVKIAKWLPQNDILNHPKVKLFIYQGGMQSTDEAINSGVPVIGVPMFGDQGYNIEKVVQYGVGIRLNLNDITEETLRNAIEEVMSNNSYRSNIEHLRSLMADQPQPPLLRAVMWVEHVLKHGNAQHLRSYGADATLVEYFLLDVLFWMLVVVAVLWLLMCWLLKICFRIMWFKVKSS